MRKLFPINNKLQITSFLQIRYDGSYTLEDVSPTEYNCHTKDFKMHIQAEGLEVQHLFEEGFLLQCSQLKKFSIERIAK